MQFLKSCLLLPVIVFFLSSHFLYATYVTNIVCSNSKYVKRSFDDNPTQRFNRMKDLYERQKYQDALSESRILVKLYPYTRCAMESLVFSGKSLMKLGYYRLAYVKFKELLKKYPGFDRREDILKYQMQIANHFFYDSSKPFFPWIKKSRYPIEIFKSIVDAAPYGKYASYAQFYLAECYRLSYLYKKALLAYRFLLDRFPESENAAESRFKIALMEILLSKNGFYGMDDFDKAVVKFELYMKENKQMSRFNIAQKELVTLKNQLAKNLLKVASYYERRKRYKAALLYYQDFYSRYSYHEDGAFVKQRIDFLKKKRLQINLASKGIG